MTAKISNKSYAIEQQNEQITHLLMSLEKAYLKDDKKPIFDKETLIFKIVDVYKVSQTKAKEYLKIIESRGNIEINGNEVHYIPTKIDLKEKEAIDKELQKVFGEQ